MDTQVSKKASKYKRHHDKHEHERSSKKRRRDVEDKDGKRGKHKRKSRPAEGESLDEEEWEEHNVDIQEGKAVAVNVSNISGSEASSSTISTLPPSSPRGTKAQRDEWMLAPTGESSSGKQPVSGPDFFSELGVEVRKKPPPKPTVGQPKISSKELNPDLRESAGLGPMDAGPTPVEKKIIPGGAGSQWRMMRLRRVYETAEEEGKPIEEVALERFGSLEAFEEAQWERRVLDEREGRRGDSGFGKRGTDFGGERRLMFTDTGGSGASSRGSFRRPDLGGSGPPTPKLSGPSAAPRFDPLRLSSQHETPVRTPIPTVMTPSQLESGGPRPSSPSSLNKLQAKALRAKLMNAPNAATLQEEYERELQHVTSGFGSGTKVEVLPTLDSRGRLYDVGHGKKDDPVLPGNRRKKEEKVETRDPATGQIVRYNADDDTTTLSEMLRQERFGAGMADQKNLNAQYARAILSDAKFENDLEYIDDNAEKLGRQKMRSDAMKRQFAINDYKKTQKVLAECPFCYGEDDSPPRAPVVSMGTRVYLSCVLHEELVQGHCIIVPIQHHLSMLEGDDDIWDEVRNFMKSLIRMFAEDDKGVIFYETVISLKWQKHTVIECVPLPWAQFDEIPAYFKESILAAGSEWSQHRKLIDFSARPGGFRRAMVPNLPYFMVQFDHKGEKGFGHVIEGSDKAGDDEDVEVDGSKAGGDFPKYFAGEIIGNILDLEPRRWRRPRRVDFQHNQKRVSEFRKKFSKFDWAGSIGE